MEATEEFRRHSPDITLMDLRLPGTTGTDTLIAIRGKFSQARIIILTTSDGDGRGPAGVASGSIGVHH